MKISLSRIVYFSCFLVLLFGATSCKMGRFVYYNFANITDYKIFPSRTAKNNDSLKFVYPVANNAKFPKKLTQGGVEITFDDYLKNRKTVAFLIIKDDSIHYENYFNGYSQESVVASFSMAKSVTSILIGCAIDDGLIKSVDDPIINYIPEMKHKDVGQVTIKQVLNMRSGIKFNESYVNPFGDAATYYYGRNLRKSVYKRKLEREPDAEFNYISGDTQILGVILDNVLKPKGKTITSYLEEKLWRPLGMEYDATWSLDRKKNGLEKTFCCLNARARDFSKIGRLYLNKGNWNGKQLVSSAWVEESTRPDTGPNAEPGYKYQWWLGNNGVFSAEGILGQYIYVNPAKNLVIVRLGENTGGADWDGIFEMLAAKY
jgi:CubicO group peptidase (beta-lactamase class C family)